MRLSTWLISLLLPELHLIALLLHHSIHHELHIPPPVTGPSTPLSQSLSPLYVLPDRTILAFTLLMPSKTPSIFGTIPLTSQSHTTTPTYSKVAKPIAHQTIAWPTQLYSSEMGSAAMNTAPSKSRRTVKSIDLDGVFPNLPFFWGLFCVPVSEKF